MKKNRIGLIVLLIFMFTAVACGSADPTPTPVSATDPPPTPTTPAEPVPGIATVESLQVVILESFPVQVQAAVRGVLPDGCTELDQITTAREGNTFTISLTTLRDNQAICTEAEVPFAENVALDALDLDAGQYTVTANGINGSFTLDMDNRIPDQLEVTPAPEPTPMPAANAAINGRVWHDLCAVAGDEEEAPDGCVPADDGGFQADGILDAGEPGIEGVLVQLGAGACPAVGLGETLTDGNGRFAFTDLAAGNYCVSVDALTAPNDATLLPGGWSGEADAAVTLAAGETRDDLKFGWDFQFLPIPNVDQAACTRSFDFVADVTVPDDTPFAPGERFVKTWQLRNTGTCPWIGGYSLVFVGGDQMGGPDTQPLTAVVAPGQTVELSLSLTAPETPGSYRGNWQLADAEGAPFGVGGFVEEAIFVQIISAIAEPTPEPGTAVLGGLVWADFCSLNDDGSTAGACVETGEGSGLFIADGSFQASEERLDGIEVTLSQGVCPTEGAIEESSVLARTATDADGLYRFPGMDAGTYCISINAFSANNVNELIPGDWTWPARGVPWFTAVLDPGEQFLDIDFGWDYQFD